MTPLDALLQSAPRSSAQEEPLFGEAFRLFYERHFDFVYRVVARLAGPDLEADDLVQEIFTIAGQKLAEFEGRAKETTWLFRIAANVVNAERRKRKRQHLLGLRWLRPPAEESIAEGPDRELEKQDIHRLVHELLQGLSEKKRAVFVLFELEGLSGQEIAELVECPLDTVWTRLFHARRDFKRLLEARGIRSLADLPGGES